VLVVNLQADFHAAMGQRANSGLAGLGGVIDPPAPALAVPTGGGPSEPAAAPANAVASTASSYAVRWEDIGGLDEAKARIEELVVWPYSRAAELRALGVRRPAVGLLLYGPPGTGKTMLARACAHQVKASFVALELSAIVGAHVGESERTLASVFASARRAAPAILFLDELDALFVGRSDTSPGSTGGGSTDRLTTTLATELDRNADELASQLIVTPQQQQTESSGRSQSEGLRGVFVIAATNNAAKIDPTLRSAGRLESALSIGYPDRQARLHIARKILGFGSLGHMVDADVTAELLADLTEPSANSLMVSAQYYTV
jgi:transitional endoplasmic reticulum ATPase